MREKRPTNLHNQRTMLVGFNFSTENDLEDNFVVRALQMPREDQPAPGQDVAIKATYKMGHACTGSLQRENRDAGNRPPSACFPWPQT